MRVLDVIHQPTGSGDDDIRACAELGLLNLHRHAADSHAKSDVSVLGQRPSRLRRGELMGRRGGEMAMSGDGRARAKDLMVKIVSTQK